ncbi:AMP-binding protein [Methylobacterium nodulans]|uniref:AMP-dependent synthetase and ligase n=1 Tax=Methylobacterium nodulans (strain LMG 21967 / CNCM I-2342 / ORS 2060) TaxID=460265 RepID=B8ITF5_METNO|nr:AMP-binding protein [Methylobacterium nodulans]ACL58871.1 AMP-dependent synthetase and ligase [Methylobacterium nodulans ORS 2060]
MSLQQSGPGLSRIRELISLYADPKVSVAEVLCDRYTQDALAYKVVGSDLEATNLTYGDLRVRSERFASALAGLGVGPGDRVATLMGKSVEYLVTLLAIWRLGAVHVPIFTAFAPPAIAFRLLGSRAKVIVCDAAQQPKLAPGQDIPADAHWKVVTTAGPEQDVQGALRFADLVASSSPGMPAARLGGDAPIIEIYTSGTTGRPKGVVVPTRALAGFRAYAEFGLGIRADDLYWCAADPGWAYGLYFGILGSLSTGVPSLLYGSGFDAGATLEILSRYGVTNFTAAPTVYRSLRVYSGPIPKITKLRCASSAGEPLTPDVNLWAGDALGVAVHDHYGQTEAGMLINNHHHPDLRQPLKPGSMGRPLPGWSMLVLKDQEDAPAADGELGRVAVELSESPLAWFSGYIDDPQKSAEKFAGNGRWYLTGDAGRRDEDGYYHFASRDDDVIIMAGYRIGPFEIESIIVTHPAVSECAVIAVPDETRGEVLEAYVVLRSGEQASPEIVREIQSWVKTRYAAHAFPRKVHFTEALPKTASGKVQRFVLRQQRRAELASQVPEAV